MDLCLKIILTVSYFLITVNWNVVGDSEVSTTKKYRHGGVTVQRAEEDQETPEWIYRNIVERCINFFWNQEDRILELKPRERRIQNKTKANLRTFFHKIKEVDDYIRGQLDGLADKFWNPKKEHPPPLKPEVVPYFLKAWDKIEKIVDDDIQKLQGVETEIEEIRDLIKRGRDELSIRSEDIQKQMKKLAEIKRELGNYDTTPEGTTVSE